MNNAIPKIYYIVNILDNFFINNIFFSNILFISFIILKYKL